jgi:uncharacterized protein DUF1524
VLRPGLLLVVLLASGCAFAPTPQPISAKPTAEAPVPSGVPAGAALDELTVGPRQSSGPSYDRDLFGSSWADVDGNGCNQRDDVLLRDAVPGSVTVGRQGGCDHDVLAGSWVDPYTGRTLVFDDLKDPHQSQAIQIDHVVPLAEAWRSGASSWPPARRRAFANDLSELLAADGPTNAAKGDDDPAAWRPRQAFQCEYAERWVGVKSRWSLTADRSEIRALREMLAGC